MCDGYNYGPGESKEQDGSVETNEVHIIDCEIVAGKVIDTLRSGGHCVKIRDEVKVGIGAANQEIKDILPNWERRIHQKA